MFAYSPKNLDGLLKIFTFDKKRDLEKYCKDITIYKSDFAAFIRSCKMGNMPFQHMMHTHDRVPKHLEITESSMAPLKSNGPGPLNEAAKKSARNLFQFFIDRRFIVGHMFYNLGNREWHLFYFDQRDMEETNNHWENGSHIHYINWLWPSHSIESVWRNLIQKNETPKGGLHIRFASSYDK